MNFTMPVSLLPKSGKAPSVIVFVMGLLAVAALANRQSKPRPQQTMG